jgi:hypothetical protein
MATLERYEKLDEQLDAAKALIIRLTDECIDEIEIEIKASLHKVLNNDFEIYDKGTIDQNRLESFKLISHFISWKTALEYSKNPSPQTHKDEMSRAKIQMNVFISQLQDAAKFHLANVGHGSNPDSQKQKAELQLKLANKIKVWISFFRY